MHHHQLVRALQFLDAYHPADPAHASLVSNLADCARREPTRCNLERLARQIDVSPFRLRRSNRLLPGLAMRIRGSAPTTSSPPHIPTTEAPQ